jgi:hypothetical protein
MDKCSELKIVSPKNAENWESLNQILLHSYAFRQKKDIGFEEKRRFLAKIGQNRPFFRQKLAKIAEKT